MVSSRRLAREWALKILYQRDVGKTALEEALETALERLRREFVQRGSRTASGSRAEEICLDYVTADLRDALADMSAPFERILAYAAGRVVEEAPYWQELRFERAFRTQAPGIALNPPRLLAPLPEQAFLPPSTDPLAGSLASLSPDQRSRLQQFTREARETLPRLLDPELRLNARQFAKALAAERPLNAGPEVVEEYLRQRREAFNRVQIERWRKIGSIVQKQTGDWLRTAAFTVKLVNGAYEQQREIDTAIESLSSGWSLGRQVAVDRNILRLAGYEMLFLPGIPAGATINEAVELAKKYSTAESGRFVNGVLGALAARVSDKLLPSGEAEAEDTEDTLDLPDISALEDTDTT